MFPDITDIITLLKAHQEGEYKDSLEFTILNGFVKDTDVSDDEAAEFTTEHKIFTDASEAKDALAGYALGSDYNTYRISISSGEVSGAINGLYDEHQELITYLQAALPYSVEGGGLLPLLEQYVSRGRLGVLKFFTVHADVDEPALFAKSPAANSLYKEKSKEKTTTMYEHILNVELEKWEDVASKTKGPDKKEERQDITTSLPVYDKNLQDALWTMKPLFKS
ncbi:MAG: hypothetical protein ABIC95_00610 [archaeon]